jgi:hypothetical protein
MQEEAAMQHRNRWLVVTLISAGILLSACQGAKGKNEPLPPAASVQGNRVVLVPKAAERIGVQTAPVREEQVLRKRTIGAEVVGPGAVDPSRVGVKLLLNESELPRVDRSKPARVLPLAGGAQPIGTAQVAARLGVATDLLADKALYYTVDGSGQDLAPGQRVLVEVPLAGNGLRKVVPSSAVIHDTKGKAYVYTNPEPLAFVRQPVTVEYFDGDRAILSEGPPPGTPVVTVGVAALFGAETGAGK